MHTDISLERVKQAFKEKAIEIPGRRPRTDHCWQHLLCMLFQSVMLVFQENIPYPFKFTIISTIEWELDYRKIAQPKGSAPVIFVYR